MDTAPRLEATANPPRTRAGAGEPRLPDFLAVGPPRTASTWLDQALRGHVGLPMRRKETDFFKRNYWRGIDWYADYFRHCPPDLPAGEICPTYFPLAESRQRIAMHIPQCRIIVTLRDPVERAYSYYRMLARYAWERASFEQAVERRADIADCNRYAFHLRAWYELFGADRVLVCINEDLKASPQTYIDRICDFIGAPRFTLESSAFVNEEVNGVARAPKSRRLARHARNTQIWLGDHGFNFALDLCERAGVWSFCFGRGEEFKPLDPALEARLRERFRPEVEALETLIGRDLSAWKMPRGKR
jgi:hypothetical protein